MNDFDKTWAKLTAAARKAPAGGEAAPFGFSTRVAALALSGESRVPSAFGRMALRAAAAACLLAVVAVAVNFSAITGAFDDSSPLGSGDDPVAEVVDVGS
jgi:hypothetical protein